MAKQGLGYRHQVIAACGDNRTNVRCTGRLTSVNPPAARRCCEKCGTPLPPQTGRGRPRKYCTDPECIAANGRSDRRRRPCSVCRKPTEGGTGSKAEDRICRTCRQAGHGDTRPQHTLTCKQCNQPFTATDPGRKYCSQRCSWQGFRATHPAKPAEIQLMERLIREHLDEAEEYVAKLKHSKQRSRERQKTKDRTGVTGRRWQEQRVKVKARQDPCWVCGLPIDWQARPRTRWSFSVDHKIPRSKGGHPYALANLETAHYGCNSRRGNRGGPSNPLPARKQVEAERW